MQVPGPRPAQLLGLFMNRAQEARTPKVSLGPS